MLSTRTIVFFVVVKMEVNSSPTQWERMRKNKPCSKYEFTGLTVTLSTIPERKFSEFKSEQWWRGGVWGHANNELFANSEKANSGRGGGSLGNELFA